MQPPALDTRDSKALIQKMKEMIPYYTPEWSFDPDDPDAGAALLFIFTRMMEGTIKRFNQVPLKNMVSFLNMMDATLLPSQPAQAWLSFFTSASDIEPVHIPGGIQIAANAGGQALLFETQSDLMVTPASVQAAFTSSAWFDSILELPTPLLEISAAAPSQEYRLFDFRSPENLQQHCFYLGHEHLFNISEGALIEILINHYRRQHSEAETASLLGDPSCTEWSYSGKEGWIPFEGIRTNGNRLVLTKENPGEIAEQELQGVNSRWLRCRVQPGKISQLKLVEFDNLDMRARYLPTGEDDGLRPDMVFCNDLPLDREQFYPFGEFFALYDTFYISAQEAFSKKQGMITLSFSLRHEPKTMGEDSQTAIEWKMVMKKSDLDEPEPPRILITRVSWEYYNGQGWTRLFPGSEYEDLFLHPADRPRVMRFKCPEDLEQTAINNHTNYWLRARVLSINNMYAAGGIYQTPFVEHMRLDYEYENDSLDPQAAMSVNNLEWHDLHQDLQQQSLVSPFNALEQKEPALYLGFDQPPEKGPLSIYFSFRFNSQENGEKPLLHWEYLKQEGISQRWVRLELRDETSGFTESGLVIFNGPADFAQASCFGHELYWIRVVNTDGKYLTPGTFLPLPVVTGIYPNTVKAVQQESINAETFNNPEEEVNKNFTLRRSPVVSEEVWVEEAARLTDRERDEMVRNQPSGIRVESDEWGNIKRLWVKWVRVSSLDFSGPHDRHYVIDRALGLLRFGDGHNGRIPPPSSIPNIEVNYKAGGGEHGNLPVGSINQLQVSVAYIDRVFNPESAVGGCDRENISEAINRVPHTIKHGNRAVTAGDFEAICMEVSRNVERVKCLPNINARGEKESGCLTLVVMPRGGRKAAGLFPVLKQEIERELMLKAAGTLAFPHRIRIIQPAYLKISVNAVVVVKDLDAVIGVEREAEARLEQFFQPAASDALGSGGWTIGEYPSTSLLYTLLKSVAGVVYVEKVTMSVFHLMDEGPLEIDADSLPGLPHGMVMNGQHRIQVKVKS
ncbi:MAG: hypothetical protein GXY34_10935 [Syntrophomonadaceae bacterium]|nr:hypothetical protein [Syntrophomonadaceae bacterium]